MTSFDNPKQFAIFNQFAIVAKTWLVVFIHLQTLNYIVMVISKPRLQYLEQKDQEKLED